MISQQERFRLDDASGDAKPHIREPRSFEDTGIDFGLILDLALKTVFRSGRLSSREVSERIALPFPIVDETMTFLRHQALVEIMGSSGLHESEYEYSLTSKGLAKAQEALQRSSYAGPAPVPFDAYLDVVARQTVRNLSVSAKAVERALSSVVLAPEVVEQLGSAVGSGRSVYLFGESGNGKSTIARAFGAMLPGCVLIPHAVEVHGQIVRVYDPRVHQAAGLTDDAAPAGRLASRRDKRWVLSRRPVVLTGGELNLVDLELRYSQSARFYVAPAQMQANNGVLVLDDFGRQRVTPADLLNRWLVPLEHQIDHLSLDSGETIDVPFDLLLVFASNIPPASLGDEAFFRRIRHKVHIDDPTEQDFRHILRREVAAAGMHYAEKNADHLIESAYRRRERPFRGVHPRDIIALIQDSARYRGQAPEFSDEAIDGAVRSYFVDLN